MPGLEKLTPDKVPEQYRIILIIATIIATCLALYLVVALLMALIRAVMRHVARRRFSDQHSVRVPPKVEVRRNKTPTTNTYVLRCPAWQRTTLLLLIELALVAGLVYWFLNMRSQHLDIFPHGTMPTAPNASGMPDATDGDSEADEPIDDPAQESATGANPSPDPGYVLPESDSELVSPESLMGMSAHDLFVARNEIYARHGCIFETESLREHFGACPWYVPKTPSADFDDGELSRIEQENVRRILGVEMPKTMGRTTYVASYYTREHAEQHPDRSCAYNGHVDGNLLQIEGTWDISDDGGHADMNCTQWYFHLSDDLRVQSSGGDAPDANLHVMTREELRDMLGGPSGLGLRLVTNDDGQVTEIDWMS